MKKILLLIIPFLFISTVNADVLETIYVGDNTSELDVLLDSNIPFECTTGTCSPSSAETELLSYYNQNLASNYPYYAIKFDYGYGYATKSMFLYYSDSDEFTYVVAQANEGYIAHEVTYFDGFLQIVGDTIDNTPAQTPFVIYGGIDNQGVIYHYYQYYDSNVDFLVTGDYGISNFYDNSSLILSNDSNYPKVKDLMQYTSWNDYYNNNLTNYTEVNLDNYEYVILNLKDYSQKQPFQTNLYLQGQIGITPVYNFGQTSKDAVTGVQVQDRCNLEYTSYTEYPFYILESDLQNNAIYYVKSCSDNSSFKFDNTIFSITYITQANLDSPTVTINGKTYNTIPYSDLPSTATENEENNYIPGQSGQANSTGGLDSAVKNAQNRLSEIWNTITYFTSFVGLLFSALPSELSTILISAFIVVTILGIIKLFVGH